MSVTPTPSSSSSLAQVRAGVLDRPGLRGAELRAALVAGYEPALRELFVTAAGAQPDRFALAAVGSFGRGEIAPYSDLDLLLLYARRGDDVAAVADAIWYPIWDAGIGLDHSVRSVDEAISVARADLKAMLGLLDLRHVAGDAGLTGRLRERALDTWRNDGSRRLAELRELGRQRAASAGDGAFLLEPNLKDSAGGLRDAQTVRQLALAQLVDLPVAVREANTALLDVRGELHRVAGRGEDVLRLEDRDAVASALGLPDTPDGPDRDAVLRTVNLAARTVSHALDVAWRRVERATAGRSLRQRVFGRGSPEVRVGLADGVVAQDGEVVLARDADPWSDPVLLLRAARAAAAAGLPLAQHTLDRFATEQAPAPEPWPAELRTEFVRLLGTGAAAVPVIEALDLAELWARLIPEWNAVRCRAQHNPVHRYTVDRHLLETAAEAATRAREVDRPDLLLVGALLHDLGKGYPGDHSVVGAEHARAVATRMGFPAEDVETVVALVRHHLLLPDTATRRDLDDPRTVELVRRAVPDVATLDLLAALTVADGHATGSATAWSEWKAGLVSDLVARVRASLRGTSPPAAPALDRTRLALAEAGELAVVVDASTVLVAAPDAPGVLHRTAAVLALHSLDVRSAAIGSHAGMAVNAFVVEPRFGRVPDPARIRADLARALAGTLDVDDALRAKERSYADDRPPPAAPTVHWFDDEATAATIVEFRAADAIGLLSRVAAALERSGLDVRSARVTSLGGAVIDAFYVTTGDGRRVPLDTRHDVELALSRV